MSTNWDYAQHSKMVSEFGGPEAFVKAIKAGAYATGKLRGLVGGLAVGAVAGVGLLRAAQVGAAKYRRVQAEAAAAEAALLEKDTPGWEPPTDPDSDPARKTGY
jgi:hypothetical protein